MAAAEAISEGIASFGSRLEVFTEDALTDHTPWPFRSFPRLYVWLSMNPWAWRFAYFSTQHGAGEFMDRLSFLVDRGLWSLFQAHRPHVIVSVHPMLQHAPISVLRAHGVAICKAEEDVEGQASAAATAEGAVAPSCVPFVTVVTDPETGTNLWLHKEATRIMVPSEAFAARARRRGLREAQLLRTGALLVRPAFHGIRALDRSTLRRELGLAPERQTVLLMGGGGGASTSVFRRVAEELGRTMPFGEVQLVVICGRNEGLRAQLERSLGQRALPGHLPARVLGFTADVARWMRAADVLLTKAGPSTIAEALTVGLPMVLYSFLPGQERGNVAYVLREGVGAYAPQPRRAAAVAAQLLSAAGAEALAEMRRRAAELAPLSQKATSAVVNEIARLATEQQLKEQPAWSSRRWPHARLSQQMQADGASSR